MRGISRSHRLKDSRVAKKADEGKRSWRRSASHSCREVHALPSPLTHEPRMSFGAPLERSPCPGGLLDQDSRSGSVLSTDLSSRTCLYQDGADEQTHAS